MCSFTVFRASFERRKGFFAGCSPLPEIRGRPAQNDRQRVASFAVLRRIIYRIDHDALVILDIYAKTTRETPDAVINICQQRLKAYDTD